MKPYNLNYLPIEICRKEKLLPILTIEPVGLLSLSNSYLLPAAGERLDQPCLEYYLSTY